MQTRFILRPDRSLFPKLRVIRQLFASYIMCETEGTGYLIDQHAAHERIRYEEVKFKYNNRCSIETQELLSPISVGLSNSRQRQYFQAHLDEIIRLGFKARFRGDDEVLVQAIPTFGYRRILPSMIRKLKMILYNIQNQSAFKERVFKLIACHSAIRANFKLKRNEMYQIIAQLSRLRNPWVCPHGRPTIKKILNGEAIHQTEISRAALDKQFKR